MPLRTLVLKIKYVAVAIVIAENQTSPFMWLTEGFIDFVCNRLLL